MGQTHARGQILMLATPASSANLREQGQTTELEQFTWAVGLPSCWLTVTVRIVRQRQKEGEREIHLYRIPAHYKAFLRGPMLWHFISDSDALKKQQRTTDHHDILPSNRLHNYICRATLPSGIQRWHIFSHLLLVSDLHLLKYLLMVKTIRVQTHGSLQHLHAKEQSPR